MVNSLTHPTHPLTTTATVNYVIPSPIRRHDHLKSSSILLHFSLFSRESASGTEINVLS